MSLFHPNGPEAVNKGHASELIALISSCALAWPHHFIRHSHACMVTPASTMSCDFSAAISELIGSSKRT